MKPSTLLLAASVAINAALLAIFLTGAATGDASVNAKGVSGSAPAAASVRRDSASRAALEAGVWDALKTEDAGELANRLQDAGFAPEIVRQIVISQIRAGFAERRRELDSNRQNMPFWKNAIPDPQVQAAQRALDREMQAAVRAALGADPDSSIANTYRLQYPEIDPDKLTQIVGIRERYDEERQKLMATMAGASLSLIDSEKLTALDRAMNDEFAAVLGPQEWEEFSLRTSTAARSLLNTLSAFDVTESEFRALYRIQTTYDAARTAIGPGVLSQEQSRQMTAARNQQEQSIKALFTPERYAQYQRATNSNYRDTQRLVTRLALPPDTTEQVYAVQTDIQGRINSLARSTPNLEQRNAQLAQLAAETETRVTSLLGPSGYQAYKQYGGSWMQNLTPRPPPTPPAR